MSHTIPRYQIVGRDKRSLSPAQLLQLALIEDALLVIRSNGRNWKRPSARARYVAEARDWIASDYHHPDDPHSFRAVCESLALSAEGIRRMLADALTTPGWQTTESRRTRRRGTRGC